MTPQQRARREFLRFLAASPLMSPLAAAAAWQEQSPVDALITAPEQALNVFDFEAVAREAAAARALRLSVHRRR